MRCVACQVENRAGRRFCAECGAALSVTCAACGFSNEPGEKFCGGCGAAVAPDAADEAPPAPDSAEGEEAERRQVTILFADLSGFTELSRGRDPEDTHRLLNRFFSAVDGTIEAYGGSVDKHIGDAVMALFGVPTAHSNDPERAVRAALDVHQAVAAVSEPGGPPLQVHIGIASGQVMATGMGSESHREYTVLGDSVNLASRLVEMAAPGQTLISDAVYRAVPDLVEVDEVSDVAVKGLEKAVTVWRLRSLSGGGGPGSRSPFVGRRAELRQFQGVLESYAESGSGQTIYLRGEAGIGKTRLLQELAAMAQRQSFVWHGGLVLDFGVGKGQGAILAVLRSLLGIEPGSDKAGRRAAAERALEQQLLGPDQLIFLHDLLDVGQDVAMRAMYDAMDNEVRNRGKQDCVITLIERASARQPLFITVEDLHSANPRVLAYLAAMAATAARCRMILVLTSRVDGDPLDQSWRHAAGSTPLMTIDLAPLGEQEALALAAEFVDASNRFAATCVERAEGNPLFLEQLLRSALASDEEAVPGSVQSIVLARVDRLAGADKRALQAAAVLGQRFSLEVLGHLVEDPSYDCRELVALHLVSVRGGQMFFAHALIWETVYASLLTNRRHELHRRAGHWFLDRDPALRAEHLERGDDPAAPGAYIEAARAQATLYRLDRALELVERGLGAGAQAAERITLLLLKGEYLGDSGRPADSIAVYRQALEATDDQVAQCRARIGLAAGMRVTDDYDGALEALDEAQAVAAAHGLEEELSQIHYYRGNIYFRTLWRGSTPGAPARPRPRRGRSAASPTPITRAVA
jgi:class 3 adenylate cyclase